jgi:hypothetical protein
MFFFRLPEGRLRLFGVQSAPVRAKFLSVSGLPSGVGLVFIFG